MVKIYTFPLTKKATRLLADNIAALLKSWRLTQHDFAMWCGHSDPWASDVLSHKRRMVMDDLDKASDLFRLAPYQLFMPGISQASERRTGLQRRTGTDRRVTHAERLIQTFGATERTSPARAGGNRGRVHEPAAASDPLLEQRRKLTEDYERRLSALILQGQSGGQDATPDRALPRTRPRRRASRGPDPKKAEK